VDFKPKLVRRDKEAHFILIKGAMHQEEITTVNLYVPNASATNFMKHILVDLKAQRDPNTVIAEDFTTFYHQNIGHPDKKNQQRNSRIE
jgi:hypothetical protein